MGNKLAVLLVHGILNNDEQNFAATGVRLLKNAFSSASGLDADEALVIRTAPWGQVSQPYEDRLLRRLGGERGKWFYDWLNRTADKIDIGSVTALAEAGMSTLVRTLPWGPVLHYPALRWFLDQYVGDMVAYQITPYGREFYDGVHAVLAQTLGEVTAEAGVDAPLFVLSHRLGTVISSDFFYDRQRDAGLFGGEARAQAATPLERGETLASFYTLGSVIALFTLRFSDDELNRPVIVPDPGWARSTPGGQRLDEHLRPRRRGRIGLVHFGRPLRAGSSRRAQDGRAPAAERHATVAPRLLERPVDHEEHRSSHGTGLATG